MWSFGGQCGHAFEGKLVLLNDCIKWFLADPVRLVSQAGEVGGSAGRLEISINGAWGSVCHNFFDRSTANVACRHLGFPDGVISFNNAANLR